MAPTVDDELPAKFDIGEGHQIPGLAADGLAEQNLVVGQWMESLQIPVPDQKKTGAGG
jgi:hypothetical protein